MEDGGGLEEGGSTLQERRFEERKRREYEERYTERLHHPDDIPAVSFTRGYVSKTPIDKFKPENKRPNFDASSTMPITGEKLDTAVGDKFAGRLSLLEAVKFKDWANVKAQTGMVACQVADAHGRLPLLLALTGGAPVGVSLGLLKAYPQAAAKPDPYGNLPLHIAISRQLEIELLVALHEAHPKSSSARDQFSDLPLHLVLKQTKPVEPPEEVVEETVPEPEASPWWATATSFVHALGAEKRGDAHEQETSGGSAKIASISQLVSVAQESTNIDESHDADETDQADPLGKWKYEVVRMLLSSNQEAVVETCGNGKFPLHMATEARTAPEIVLVLLELIAEHPEDCARFHAVSLDYPMHTALSHSAAPDIIAR